MARAERVTLDQLAADVGLDIDHAYRLLRLGRGQGRPETTHVDPRQVPIVAVLARLEALLSPPEDLLLRLAHLVRQAADTHHGTLIGLPRAIVAPMGDAVPPPAIVTRSALPLMVAGRAAIVLDLGTNPTPDWTPLGPGRHHR